MSLTNPYSPPTTPPGDPSPPASPALVPALWTPRVIAVCGILLSFASALVLAAINWRQIGQARRARAHLLAGIPVLLLVLALAVLLPERSARGITVLINISYFFYLRPRMLEDILQFRAAHPDMVLRRRSWYSGVGIGLLVGLAVGALSLVLSLGLDVTGNALPE